MQKEENAYPRKSRKLISLKNNTAFNIVNNHGNKYKGRFFIMVSAPWSKLSSLPMFELESCYLGFKIGRKVGNAVKRNFLRRRVKSIMRQQNTNSSYCHIFIARSNCCELSFAELQKEIEKCLNRL